MSSLRSLNADHVAALLHLGSFIDQEDGLSDFDLHLQFQQPTVRIDDHRLRFFAHIFTIQRPGLHDYGNLQHYTLAAPAVCWIGIRHFVLTRLPITITQRIDEGWRDQAASDDFVTIEASPPAGPLPEAIRSQGY